MRSNLRKFLDDTYGYIENTYRGYARYKYMKKIVKQSNGGNKIFDSEYRGNYLKYWKKYGKKPKKIWLRLYAKESEGFTPRYIPDNIWFSEILPYFCNMSFRRSYEDKCLHDKLFPMLIRPRTIVKCMAGLYFDSNGNEITEKEAKEIIMSENEAIIKPSIDSGTGRLIQFYEKGKDTLIDLNKKLENINSNFICQEIVKQHKDMMEINPKTLNTVRVITFNFDGEIHILSVITRMGAGDARVDNVSAGGLQVTVNKETGSFSKYAMDINRKSYSKHPDTGFVFEGFTIPSFNKVIECSKIGAKQVPHFKIIGWDFAIGYDGEPVFIEYNVCPDQNQMTAGPTFGELTEKVLDEVYITKKFKDSKN